MLSISKCSFFLLKHLQLCPALFNLSPENSASSKLLSDVWCSRCMLVPSSVLSSFPSLAPLPQSVLKSRGTDGWARRARASLLLVNAWDLTRCQLPTHSPSWRLKALRGLWAGTAKVSPHPTPRIQLLNDLKLLCPSGAAYSGKRATGGPKETIFSPQLYFFQAESYLPSPCGPLSPFLS